MSKTGFRLALMLFVVGVGLTAQIVAQGTQSARGTVTAVSADSITVKAGTQELKFAVDSKTVLTASGAGTADQKAEAAGKPGPRLTDFIKAGDNVEVRYQETGGTMRASNIRHVNSAGSGGGSVSGDRSMGTVDSISASTLVITGSAGGGGSFKQSFAVDGTTKVIAAGASTAAQAAKGGRIVLSEFVGVGDEVTVNYHKVGAGLHADEIRVRTKGKK